MAVFTRSTVKRWISSAALRLFAKQIVRRPREVSCDMQSRRVAERARAQAELGIEQRRVPDDDLALGLRRGVALDDRRRLTGERLGQLARVRDRRRSEQELRLGLVDACEPPQPAQDVGHVRPEDAAVDVRLVHDDVAQVVQDVAPAVVVREDADVEHVRVREDQVRPLADLPAPLARRVAVVDRGLEPLQPQLGERASLVLRERLRRVEVERPRLRLARDRVEHREVERERLPGGGPGRDDDVLAALRCLPGLGLVAVERGDAVRDERGGHAWIEVVGKRFGARVPGRLDAGVRDLLALEQVGPARRDLGRHAASVAAASLVEVRARTRARSETATCAPKIVTRASPSAKSITVGSERTP